MALGLLILFASLFVASHVVLSGAGVKKAIVGRLGAKGFSGIYALSSFLTLGATVYMYAGRGVRGPALWVPIGWSNPVLYILMLFCFLFLVTSTATPSPVGADMGAPSKPVARGILRVTAHPQNWAMICFGVAHVLATGTAGGLAMYGLFALLGIIGSYHETAKKARDADEAVQAFLKQTGVIPFSAIIRGRTKLVLSEFKLASVLIALALFGVSIGIHFLV